MIPARSATSSASASSRSPTRICSPTRARTSSRARRTSARRQAEKPKLPDRPVRVIYVDPTTGLPMRSIFARANKLDKPIFEATYSYPADIKIDVSAGAGAPSDTPPAK